jgi:aldose 1-epimerase
MRIPPSGEQFEIRAGGQRATIVEVGGGLREYEVDGRPVLEPYPVDRIRDGAHGAPLIPWPNRLADGRYSFDGEEHQLALTEPERRNAIHGLLLWRPWRVVDRDDERLVMGARLHPRPGYPFPLDVRIAYELGEGGLCVTTTAENIGERACPYGHGQHPYLSPGDGLIDDCFLQLEAGARIVTDPDRLLPAGREPVRGTAFDFAEPRVIGDTRIDHPFTDLARDASGRAWARLLGTDGARAELWVDETYPFVQLYTGDSLRPDRARRGLAAEPMTCAPNAFASGEELIRLEPGESATTSWGVRLS